MQSLEWTLIPQDWGPDKKRRSGHRHSEGRPWEDTGRGRPSARPGGGLRRTSAARTQVWESSLQAWRQRIRLSKLPWLWDFVMVA